MALTKKNILLLVFGISLLLPIFTWIISIYSHYRLSFSFSSFIQLHVSNPAIFIVDLIPVITTLIASYLYDKWETFKKEHNKIQSDINFLKGTIDKVSTFAEKIGNGDYDYEFSVTEDSDLLSKSIQNLRDKLYESNKQESVRNWMMLGKDQISNILRIHNDLDKLSYEVLATIIEYVKVTQGAFYILDEEKNVLNINASYAYNRKKYIQKEIKIGEGLVGQAAVERDIIHRTEIPDNYITITSGIIGDKKPQSLLIVPLITEDKLQGTLELASLNTFTQVEIEFLKEIGEIVARAIFNLKITSKTEKLLKESQQMTAELKENEEMLRQNAEEMSLTQEELERTNTQLEKKIQEVNQSQSRLYALLENASELILIYDERKELKYVSPSAIRLLGYTEDELMNGKFFDRVNFKGQQILEKLFEDLLSNPLETQTVNYSYLHKEGHRIYLESKGRNLLKDPAIAGLILNTSDITERKRAEKEQRMRGQMQSLSENSPDIIIRLDPRGQIFYNNPVIEQFTGIPYEQFYRKNLSEIGLHPDIITKFTDLIKRVSKSKEKIQAELTFTAVDGEKIMFANAIPEFNEEKVLETILLVLHDITEAKQNELMIKEKNQKITESINYAQRIQTCILPNNKLLQTYFKKSFIFYKPKDVVSGDFPWLYPDGDIVYVAAIDCTGHGVPGAMLSMIGYFIINQVVSQKEEFSAGQILDQMHSGVRKILRQDQADASARDGMDIALCKVNYKTNVLEYSGAHRPLYLIRDGELQEFKGTRSAIGGIPREGTEEQNFKNYVINIKEGDSIYFFSDGLPDQFGGDEGRKYSSKRIKELVVENHKEDIANIHKVFREDYKKWLGNGKQIDDVLLIGIRF